MKSKRAPRRSLRLNVNKRTRNGRMRVHFPCGEEFDAAKFFRGGIVSARDKTASNAEHVSMIRDR